MTTTTARRRYIEAARRQGIKSRDVLEIAALPDGTEDRHCVVSFPPGTPVTTVPEVIDALRRAYEAGREDAASLPLAARAPEIGRLLDSIRTEIEDADGSWNGGDTVSLLCEWFKALGYDIDYPLPEGIPCGSCDYIALSDGYAAETGH